MGAIIIAKLTESQDPDNPFARWGLAKDLSRNSLGEPLRDLEVIDPSGRRVSFGDLKLDEQDFVLERASASSLLQELRGEMRQMFVPEDPRSAFEVIYAPEGHANFRIKGVSGLDQRTDNWDLTPLTPDAPIVRLDIGERFEADTSRGLIWVECRTFDNRDNIVDVFKVLQDRETNRFIGLEFTTCDGVPQDGPIFQTAWLDGSIPEKYTPPGWIDLIERFPFLLDPASLPPLELSPEEDRRFWEMLVERDPASFATQDREAAKRLRAWLEERLKSSE